MTRGLGLTLALSVLLHGGAVIAVGAIGVAWLARPAPEPEAERLFVDLVEPVVVTGDRRMPADRTPSGPRPGPPPTRTVPIAKARLPVPEIPSPPLAEGRRRPDHVDEAVPPAPSTSPPGGVADIPSGPLTLAAPLSPPPPLIPAPPVPIPSVVPSPAIAPAPEPAVLPPPSVPVAVLAAPRAPVPTRVETPAALAASEATRAGDPAARRAGGEAAQTAFPAAITGGASEGTGAMVLAAPSATGPQPTGGEVSPEGAASRTGGGTTGLPADGPDRLDPAPGPVATGQALEAAGGGGVPPEYESYVRRLRDRVQRRLVYPWLSARRGQQGTVELGVTVSPDGRVAGVEVLDASAPAPLRGAAVQAVRDASPFPFPHGLPPRLLVIRLPVVFRLR